MAKRASSESPAHRRASRHAGGSGGAESSLTGGRDLAITPLYASGGEWLACSSDPSEVLSQLLDRPDAARLVRATPTQPLFLFVRTLGLHNALDILALCSADQLQAFFDMDGWDRDHVSPTRLWPWLAALTELGPAKLVRVAEGLDPELWTAVLGPRLRVHDIYKSEDPPDNPEGVFFDTPDRMFRIDILPASSVDGDAAPNGGDEDDSSAMIQRLLETLYRGDAEIARAIVHSAGYDVGPETAEKAYRFRSGRMADLGYIDYYDALKVYLLLDPQKPPPPSELQPLAAVLSASPPAAIHVLPGSDTVSGALLRSMPGLQDDDCTFARAVAHLSEPERALLVQHLIVLGNRVLSADRVELGDVDALRATLRRTVGCVSLGLEYYLLPAGQRHSEGGAAAGAADPAATRVEIDVQHAAQALREVSLLHLFRLGYSLTVQVRKLATVLLASSDGAMVTLVGKEDPVSLLPPRLAQTLRGLLAVRPLYSTLLDDRDAAAPPSGGKTGDAEPAPYRPFISLRDLGRVAAVIGEVSTLCRVLTTGLGLRRDHLESTLRTTTPGLRDATWIDLLGTAIANLLLDRLPVVVPLSHRDLPPLRDRALDANPGGPGVLSAAVAEQVTEALRERIHSRSFGSAEFAQLWTDVTRRLIADAVATLGRGLGSLPADLAQSPSLADLVPRVAGLLIA